MAEFMIQVPHTPQECNQVSESFTEKDRSFLGKLRWGCQSGEHNAWAMLQADSEDEVRNMIPDAIKQRVKITRVREMSLEQIRSMHAEKAGVR